MHSLITLIFRSFLVNFTALVDRRSAVLLFEAAKSRMAEDGIVGEAVGETTRALIADFLADGDFGTDPRDKDTFVRACVCAAADMEPGMLEGRHDRVLLEVELHPNGAMFYVGTPLSPANDNHKGADRGRGRPRRKV